MITVPRGDPYPCKSVFIRGCSSVFSSHQFVSISGLLCVLLPTARQVLRLLIGLANFAAESHVVSVRVQRDKIPHPVWLVGRFNLYDGPAFLYLLAIGVDFVAEDKGDPPPTGR